MSQNTASFQTSFVFVTRKLKYSSEECNLWTVVVPPQTMKNLRMLHDNCFVVKTEENNRVFLRVHNSVEYGMEYSFLKPPKALATEELLKSLRVSPNKEVYLNFEKVADISMAAKLSLRYLESFDFKDENWKSLKENNQNDQRNNRKDHSSLGNKDFVGSTPLDKKLDWQVSSDDSSLFPPVDWYNSLLKGEFNPLIKSSLLGSVLFEGNVVLVNLRGYLSRFLVKSVVQGRRGESKPLSVGLESELSVSLEIELDVFSDSEDKESYENEDEMPISGLDDIVERLNTHVIVPLVSELEVSPPSGVILYGPPGCGKTLLARTIRENYKKLFKTQEKLGFKMVQSTDLVGQYLGQTESNINEMFKELKEESKKYKMICFIDEIDVLCVSREKPGSDTHSKRILTTFLNNMDGINSKNNNFVVVGLTNYLENIDNALRRPGRFDLEIEVPVPNSENRMGILKSLLKKVRHNLKEEQVKHVNDFCQAFVGADLKLLLTNANHSKMSRMKRQMETSGSVEHSKEEEEEDNVLKFEDFLNALKVTRPSAMRELYVEVPQVKWEDIGGYEELKKVIKESVEYPRRFAGLYENLHIQVPKGILLYGPPGCSKTLMAKAICTESHMNFISVKGPEIFDKYVGESERNIRRMFSKARTNSPCVIFFDEIDSLCSEDSTSVSKRVVGTLLNEMDGVSPLKQVLVIGATNRPQDLTKSLLRPGRFDKLIYVPLPDFEARKAIFLINLRKVKVDFDLEEATSKMASLTEGYSGAEVAGVCRQASLYLVNEVIESLVLTQGPQRPHSVHDFSDSGLSMDFEKLSLSEVRPLSYSHLERALFNSRPMTSKETVSFYEEFARNSLL